MDTADGPDDANARRNEMEALYERARALEEQSGAAFTAAALEAAEALAGVMPSPPRRMVAAELKIRKWEEQDGLCGICGERIDDLSATDIDHIVPHTHGGGNEPVNLQLTHLGCNRRKRADVDPLELLDYVQGRYDNRPLRGPRPT